MNPDSAGVDPLRFIARAVRDQALRALRGLDDAIDPRLRPHRRRRLVFDGTAPFEFAMFQPIYRRLQAEARIDLFFTDSRSLGHPLDLYQNLGVPEEQVLSRELALWTRFDVHVSAQYFRNRFVRSLRRVQIFHGVGGKAWNVSEKAREYDRLFLISEYDRRRFVEAGLFPEDSPALEVIGMPKVDCLVDGTIDRGETLRSLGLPTKRPVVLYAPTWQTASSLYTLGRSLIGRLSRGPWTLLVKLHDNSYLPERSGGVDWQRELEPFVGLPNVRALRDADITPILVAADALITDLSSVALEYLLLDRPVIVADAPELFEKFARDEVSHWQRSLGPLLRDVAEAHRLVARALEHPNEYQATRRRIAKTVFHSPGTATGRAVDSLYRLLGLQP